MTSADCSIDVNGHKKNPGVKKAKRLSTKVDMTPMVDLGFLLITFFIFTTTLSTPTTMKLIMPKEDIDKMLLKESNALTIFIDNHDDLYYNFGKLYSNGINLIHINYNEIRKVISNKRKEVMKQGEKLGYSQNDLDKDFMVLIKPTSNAT